MRAIDIFSPALPSGQRLGIFGGFRRRQIDAAFHAGPAPDAFDKVVIALVGERGREVREFIEDTLGAIFRNRSPSCHQRREPMLRKMAPLTASHDRTFSRQGDNVLLIVDSVTRFAQCDPEVATAAGAADRPPAIRPRSSPNCAAARARRARSRGTGTITAIISILVDGDITTTLSPTRRAASSTGTSSSTEVLPKRGVTRRSNPLALHLAPSQKRPGRRTRRSWLPAEILIHRSRKPGTSAHRWLSGGGDADLDMAIKQVPVIYDVLKQMPGERPAFDAFTDLATDAEGSRDGQSAGAAGLREGENLTDFDADEIVRQRRRETGCRLSTRYSVRSACHGCLRDVAAVVRLSASGEILDAFALAGNDARSAGAPGTAILSVSPLAMTDMDEEPPLRSIA